MNEEIVCLRPNGDIKIMKVRPFKASYEEPFATKDSNVSYEEYNVFDLLRKLEKQAKEIAHKDKEIEELDKKFRYAVLDDMIDELYISKDKIREKIKELEKLRETLTDSNGMIEISSLIDTLKELLKE